MDPRVVQRLAGHTTLVMTDRYTGTLERAARQAAETLAARLA